MHPTPTTTKISLANVGSESQTQAAKSSLLYNVQALGLICVVPVLKVRETLSRGKEIPMNSSVHQKEQLETQSKTTQCPLCIAACSEPWTGNLPTKLAMTFTTYSKTLQHTFTTTNSAWCPAIGHGLQKRRQVGFDGQAEQSGVRW